VHLSWNFTVALAGQVSNHLSTLERALDQARSGSGPTSPGRSSPSRSLHKLDPAQVATLVEAYEAGATLETLAQRYELHKRTIADHLRRRGVQPRYIALTDTDIRIAAKLYRQGLSLVAIGDRFGVNDCTIMRALHKLGVTMRPRRGGLKRRKP
jgi:lambda repressor-like predicted transcriptional regulator